MATGSLPRINTDKLPMPEARDDSWRKMGECPLVDVGDSIAVTRRDLVELVLKDPALFSSKKAFEMLGSPLPLVPIAFDPPEQTRYRQILQPFFSPRAIKPLECDLRNQAIALITPIVERRECDFVAEVAKVFPIQVFIVLFGLPLDMRDQFVEWKDAVLRLGSASGVTSSEVSVEEALAKAGELYEYLSELVRTRRGVVADDILSRVLNLAPPDELSDEEAIGLCYLFVLAGLDTVADALGFGMQRLAENPDKRRELIDDPSLIPAATEELLRLDPSAPFTSRVTTREVELNGFTLSEGSQVMVYLSTGNRDETLFPNPYDIDFHRPENRHISFGLGAHRCLGSHLARLEMQVLYEEWHKRIPNYHITEGTAPRVLWPRGTVGLDSLHLTIEE